MTRTPPNVRRRLTGGAQGGPGEGILRHTQGQNKTSCGKCFPEVSGLTDHQAQMPQHESCRHIHEDYQEFIFGCISNINMSCNPPSIKPKLLSKTIMSAGHYKPSHTVTSRHKPATSQRKPPTSYNTSSGSATSVYESVSAVARVWLELLPMSDGVWPAGPKEDLERGS